MVVVVLGRGGDHHGSSTWVKDCTGQNKKEQKGRGVCREGKEGWCVLHCGWRAFVKKRDDFLPLYVLGLYLTWSLGGLQGQQLWAQHKLGLRLRRGTDKVTLAAKECVSLLVLSGKWRMRGVICGWEGSEHRPYFLWLFFGFSSVSFFFFFKLPSCAMHVFFGHVRSLRWCHCRVECHVEVLHYQPNYKVGDHLVWPCLDGGGLQCTVGFFFWFFLTDRSSLGRYSWRLTDQITCPVYMLVVSSPVPRKYIISGLSGVQGTVKTFPRSFRVGLV